MSNGNTISQVQKFFTDWQSSVTEQTGRVVDFWTQVGRGLSLDPAQTWATEVAKLSRDSFGYVSELTSELQRIQLAALRRATESFGKTEA